MIGGSCSVVNLELIINGEPWKVKVVVDDKVYWEANTHEKTLTISGMDVDKAKYQCYIQYRRK
jgi:hypothetical protein